MLSRTIHVFRERLKKIFCSGSILLQDKIFFILFDKVDFIMVVVDQMSDLTHGPLVFNFDYFILSFGETFPRTT